MGLLAFDNNDWRSGYLVFSFFGRGGGQRKPFDGLRLQKVKGLETRSAVVAAWRAEFNECFWPVGWHYEEHRGHGENGAIADALEKSRGLRLRAGAKIAFSQRAVHYQRGYSGHSIDGLTMAKRKPPRSGKQSSATTEQIDGSILVIRGQKVLLDEQLASFYDVEVKRLVEAVKRNIDRFPADFMFQLDREEWVALRSQFVTSSGKTNLRSQSATSSLAVHGGRRYAPYAFTEQGVAMLSSVIRSPRAIEVNIEIMRAFVRLRQHLSVHKELAERLAKSNAK